MHIKKKKYIPKKYFENDKNIYIFVYFCNCFKRMSVCKSKEKMKITDFFWTIFLKMGTSPKSSEPTYLHYITLQYVALRYSTLHYSKVQHFTLHYSTLHYSTVHYSKLHYIHAQDLVHKIVCHQRGTSPMSSWFYEWPMPH